MLKNKEKKHFLIIILLVVLTRLPLIFSGYGHDGDAWRVAYVSSKLWNEGVYEISRPPGLPVYEILQAPLVGAGRSILSNSVSLLMFIASIVVFWKILEVLNIQSKPLVVWLYAFTPIFWKNSATTMDFCWGLLLVLLTYFFLLEKKIFLSALVAGLAVGVRVTNLVMIIPALYFLQEENSKKITNFLAVWASVIMVCYFPVISKYGFSTFLYLLEPHFKPVPVVIHLATAAYRTVYAIGVLSVFLLALIIIKKYSKLKNYLRENDSHMVFWLLVILVYLAVMVGFPNKREYLIPAIPFLYLLIQRISSQRFLLVFTIVTISYAFVNFDVVEHEGGGGSFSAHVRSGIVIEEYANRKELMKWRSEFPRQNFRDSTIVMIGMGPIFWFENDVVERPSNIDSLFPEGEASKMREKDVYFVYALSKEEVQAYQSKGYRIYYLDAMKPYFNSFLNYDLETFGVKRLNKVHSSKSSQLE